jgi:hypothetical protein
MARSSVMCFARECTKFFSDVARVAGHREKSSSEFVEGEGHHAVAEPKRLMMGLKQVFSCKRRITCLFYAITVVDVDVNV